MMDSLNLAGRIAIVTGAGSGIGAAIATQLAKQGASVTVADIDAAAGQAVAQSIKAPFAAAGLRDPSACRSLVTETAQLFGRIGILVNNAGFQHAAPLKTSRKKSGIPC